MEFSGWLCDKQSILFEFHILHTQSTCTTLWCFNKYSRKQRKKLYWPAGCNADGRPRLESADLHLARLFSTRDPVDRNGRTRYVPRGTPTLSHACHAVSFLHTFTTFFDRYSTIRLDVQAPVSSASTTLSHFLFLHSSFFYWALMTLHVTVPLLADLSQDNECATEPVWTYYRQTSTT